jgi:hypothetical protein
MEGCVFEPANHGMIVPRQKWMKVFEQKNGGFDLFDHQIQGGQRVFGGGVSAVARLDRNARRDYARAARPLEELFLPPGGDFHQESLRAHLLAGMR